MDSTELLGVFRDEEVDVAEPHLWSDSEVYRYMGQAHLMFHRLTEGIADKVTVNVTQWDRDVELPQGTLRVMSAHLSDGTQLEVKNLPENYRYSTQPGKVRALFLGVADWVGHWDVVPATDDTCELFIRRIPEGRVTGAGQEIFGTDEIHHYALLDWMKHLAYRKPDAETFNPEASGRAEASFRQYCEQVKRERERVKHKTRVVSYGGL